MYEVGEKLKDARLAKGYTLDDMQQITKIQKRYLRAIEDGHFEVLPGDFYTRAFIKQYGDSVGLNGDELVAEFNGENDNSPSRQSQDGGSKNYSRIQNSKGGAWLTVKESLPTFIIIALVIAIIIAVYIAGTGMMNPNENLINSDESGTIYMSNEESSGGGSASNGSEETSNQDGSSTEQNIEVEDTTGTTTSLNISGQHPESQTVELQAEGGDSWVSIEVDGQTTESGLMTDGQSLETEFDNQTNEVILVIGNAPTTNILLNDQAVTYAEDMGDAVRHEVTLTFE